MGFVHLKLEDIILQGKKWGVGSFFEKESPNFSNKIEIGFVRLKEPDKSDKIHYHQSIEEYYIVLSGEMEILVDKKTILVKTKEVLGVKPKTPHIIRNVTPNTEIILIKTPSKPKDKKITREQKL